MAQIYNPYLPLTEHIPDGEPHVFDGRVYIYGSHDIAGGTEYCQDHYVTWSAPVDNLKDWRYEGVIYRRNQDPSNAADEFTLYAPDVTQGPDGKYYLYYCYSFLHEIGVAVSDSPAGPFEFYGHVKYPESMNGGKDVNEFMPFDPAVLTDDDGRVYLYYGFTPSGEKAAIFPVPTEEELAQMTEEEKEHALFMASIVPEKVSRVVELEADMITVKEEPREFIPGEGVSAGTSFEGHGFFEASSIRKFNGKYYFAYSSHKSHDLCYATSDKPDRDFVYGGVLVSNGDIGLNGNTTPVMPIGNNHGGLVEANGEYYIFYHRQTNGTEFSRQGCAEKIKMDADGSFKQVEITSCGLNGGALIAEGSYPASIACHIRSAKSIDVINYNDPAMKEQTRVTESYNESYVTAITKGTVLGYKYFSFVGASMMTVELRGTYEGDIIIATDPKGENVIGEFETQINKEEWVCELVPLADVSGVQPVYFIFKGEGCAEMKGFSFLNM